MRADRPICETPGCGRGADAYDGGLALCARCLPDWDDAAEDEAARIGRAIDAALEAIERGDRRMNREGKT